MFTIYDLQPSTKYNVRITAHNSAGSSVNTYSCSTLPSGRSKYFLFQIRKEIVNFIPKKGKLELFSNSKNELVT